MDKITAMLTTLRETAEAAEEKVEENAAEIKRLKEQEDSLDQAIESAKRRLAKYEQDSEKSKLANASLRREADDGKNTVKSSESLALREQMLEEELDKATKTLAQTKTQVDAVDLKAEAFERKTASTAHELAKLRAKCADVQAENDKITAAIDSLVNDMAGILG